MQGYDFHLVEVIAYKTIGGEAKKQQKLTNHINIIKMEDT